ncbi:response regulator [Aceticella autotrophica]|uniref:Stage 0 sporulation protein A homolog n=1 Tax=Aceticella autotrophica TaxID=2755338 RepID=A0A975GAY7_9THEO|nr:response regulator [Aceticella autotrophica]QSZ27878.1 response regulator [Aceticella autotrophica]
MCKKSILIVDDNRLSRKILKDILEKAEYIVYEAENGEEALGIYKKNLPDMVILDIVMPKMSGFDILRILRNDQENLMVPIILLTSKDDFNEKLYGLELGADDYIIKPFNEKEFIIRVKNLFQRIDHNRMANPLTGLRGNLDIKFEIKRRIKKGEPYAVMYIDLDNFKEYNDYYGFARGDKVLTMTAGILSESINLVGNQNDFLGHIGGDDFIIVTTPDKVEDICQYIIKNFDEKIKNLYDEKDRKRGYIEAVGRRGEKNKYPFVSISIAVVTDEYRKFQNELQISEVAAELKRKLKTMKGSKFLKDQRKE